MYIYSICLMKVFVHQVLIIIQVLRGGQKGRCPFMYSAVQYRTRTAGLHKSFFPP